MSETLEQIVAKHPLPWALQEDCYYDQRGSHMYVVPLSDGLHYALGSAAPGMALAIRALLAVMRAPHIERNPAIVDSYIEALRDSLPEELRL